jgi:hypothetical protein
VIGGDIKLPSFFETAEKGSFRGFVRLVQRHLSPFVTQRDLALDNMDELAEISRSKPCKDPSKARCGRSRRTTDVGVRLGAH